MLFVLLIAFSSHPAIMDLNEVEDSVSRGTVLTPFISLVFNALLIACLGLKPFIENKILKHFVAMFLFLEFSYLVTQGFFGTRAMGSDIWSIFISMGALMIGWQIASDYKKLYVLLLTYASITLYVGLEQVFINIGGFEILDEYMATNKNALGVMLASASFIFLYIGLEKRRLDMKYIVCVLLSILTIAVLLTIRARTATLSMVAMLLIMYFKRANKKYFLTYILITVFTVVSLFLVQLYYMPDILDYISNSFFQHHEQDITSDRMHRNVAGLNFLSDHIWFGNLDVNARMAWIHNYPLEKLFKYGLIFSAPILIIYVYIFCKTWMKMVKSNSHNLFNIGYYVMIIPYIISMAEPTFPFGPGTATAFNFILLGIAMKQADIVSGRIKPKYG